jgi:Ca2+-binding EF-hand superfamily protein
MAEMREALQAQGSDVPYAVDLLQKLPKDGELTLEQFTALFTTKDPTKDDMTRVFDLFDADKKGYINISDLRRIANDLGESLSEEELKDMLDRADTDGDGRVSKKDFETIMTKKLFP